MKTALIVCALILFAIQPLPAADVPDISDEAELDAALKQAGPNDVLTLDADFEITRGKAIPSKVTLLGNHHTIHSATDLNIPLINQNGQTGVLVRGVRFIAGMKQQWSIQARDGDIRFIDCFFDARAIAWANASVTIEDSTSHILFPLGNDGVGPYGSYGNRAEFTAKNSLFILGWEGNQLDNGLFINFGGNIASKLTLANCTVVATTDAHPELGGDFRQINRHICMVHSQNSEGPGDYLTTVYNSIFIGEATSVFRSSGTGTVISHHNNNAGMLRNPVTFKLMNSDPPEFYYAYPTDVKVQNRLADFREHNPFANALAGDYRLMAGTRSASAADDGGPLGARIGLVQQEHNAFNLSFVLFDAVADRMIPPQPNDPNRPLRMEDAFYGWRWHRETPQQYFLSTAEGQDAVGRAIRLEIQDTGNDTGGVFHTSYLTQSVYQTFCVVPGHVYTIKAWSRRGTAGKGTWAQNGMYGNAIIGVANGVQKDPARMDEVAFIKGPENTWTQGGIQSFRAESSQLTVHLIHKTNGSWNFGEWDNVTIEGGPNPDLTDDSKP